MINKDKELNALETDLFRYSKIDKRIAERQLELMSKNGITFWSNQTNGYLANQERVVEIWDEDVTLKNLKLFKETVELFIQQLDKEQKLIFDMIWLRGYRWSEIQVHVHCSKASIYRKRKAILELYASFKM